MNMIGITVKPVSTYPYMICEKGKKKFTPKVSLNHLHKQEIFNSHTFLLISKMVRNACTNVAKSMHKEFQNMHLPNDLSTQFSWTM